MQNKINSYLVTAGSILFFICYPIYLIWKHFNIDQLANLGESIIRYKYWILLVIIVHLLIVLGKIAPIKKPKKLDLFFLRRKPIVTVIMFIYPFLPDFQHRFARINENNVTDFYAIFLPIFIMFFISSIRSTGDPDFLKEMKDDLSIKSKTNYKVDSLIKKTSVFSVLSAYSFLFAIYTLWITLLNKVDFGYKTIFPEFPFLFFIFILGITLFLHAILGNKTDKKQKSDISNSQNLKSNKRVKKHHENVKVSFK